MPHNTRDLVAWQFGDSLAADPNVSDVTVGTAAKLLVTYNARRTHVAVSHFGGANVAIGFDASVTASTGIQLSPGQTFELDWFEDLDLVTRQLYAISASAGNPLHIVETVLTGNETSG